MPLIQVVLLLIVVGIGMWALNTYAAAIIHPPILKLINVVVIIAVVWFLLNVFGIIAYLSGIRVGPGR